MIVERQSRTRIRGSDDLSSLRAAARAWIGAATAWEAAGDPSRQIESLRRAAELFAVLGPTGRADAEEALTRSERARAAAAEDRPEPFDPHPSAGIGWAEPAIAVVEQYLADSLDANDDGLALDDDELDRLAVVAESIDQLLVAAHLRLILRDRQDPASRAWRHLGRLASEYHRSLGLEVDPGGGDA